MSQQGRWPTFRCSQRRSARENLASWGASRRWLEPNAERQGTRRGPAENRASTAGKRHHEPMHASGASASPGSVVAMCGHRMSPKDGWESPKAPVAELPRLQAWSQARSQAAQILLQRSKSLLQRRLLVEKTCSGASVLPPMRQTEERAGISSSRIRTSRSRWGGGWGAGLRRLGRRPSRLTVFPAAMRGSCGT